MRALALLNRKLGSKGLTMVEVIVSMLVLGLTVAPILGMFESSLWAGANSEYVLDATYLAQSKIETLRAADYDSVVSQGWTQVSGTPFEYSVDVQVVDPDRGLLKQVTVSVRWQRNHNTSSIRLVTLLTAR